MIQKIQATVMTQNNSTKDKQKPQDNGDLKEVIER